MFEIVTSTNLLDYRQTVTLEGVKYVFRFLWSPRCAAWFMDIMSQSLEPLLMSRRIQIGVPLLYNFHHLNVPPGEMFAIDTLERDHPPGQYELGDRVKLIYITEQETVDILASAV